MAVLGRGRVRHCDIASRKDDVGDAIGKDFEATPEAGHEIISTAGDGWLRCRNYPSPQGRDAAR
jgi:hypothetical protein